MIAKKRVRVFFIWGVVVASLAVLPFFTACGGTSSGNIGQAGSGGDRTTLSDMQIIEQIDLASSQFSITDFNSITGMKITKDFDVSELPQAVSAHKGALIERRGDTPRIYELRFYDSHSVALNQGVSYVKDVVGENRVLLEADQRWVEGHKLRITCQGQGGHHIGTCVSTYPDYIVRGNVIILCSGQALFDAQENCAFLMTKVNANS